MKLIVFIIPLFLIFTACAPKAAVRTKHEIIQIKKPAAVEQKKKAEQKKKKEAYKSSSGSSKAEDVRRRAEEAFDRLEKNN